MRKVSLVLCLAGAMSFAGSAFAQDAGTTDGGATDAGATDAGVETDAGTGDGDGGVVDTDGGLPPCDAETDADYCDDQGRWVTCFQDEWNTIDCANDLYTDGEGNPFVVDMTCGELTCVAPEDNASACDDIAGAATCVGEDDGGFCVAFLSYFFPDVDLGGQACAGGQSCVAFVENNTFDEECRPSIGTCAAGQETVGCSGDVAGSCFGYQTGGTVPDAVGVDCAAFGATCAEASGASACAFQNVCDGQIRACGSEGSFGDFGCNLVPTLPPAAGGQGEDFGNCVAGVGSCNPDSFSPSCEGDFAVLSCATYGQAVGLNCADLSGTCGTAQGSIGQEAFCAMPEGGACDNNTYRCGEGLRCNTVTSVCESETAGDGDGDGDTGDGDGDGDTGDGDGDTGDGDGDAGDGDGDGDGDGCSASRVTSTSVPVSLFGVFALFGLAIRRRR